MNVSKNYFEKLLNVHNGEKTEEFKIYTAEPWISVPSAIEVEMTVKKKIKIFKSRRLDNIPAELIKTRGTVLIKELHKLVCAIWRKGMENLNNSPGL